MAAPLPDTTLATPVPPRLPSLVSARRLRSQRLGRGLRLWVPAGILVLLLAVCFLLPLVEGIVVVFALVTVAGNLIADLLYTVLDPRIRYGRAAS